MKNKKLIFCISCIFILILNLIPFTASAASHSSAVSGWSYTGSGAERYYPPSAFGFTDSDKYLILTYTREDGDWSYNTSVAFDLIGGSFSVGSDGSYNYSGAFYVAEPKCYYKKGDASGSSWDSGNKKLIFNPSTGEINYNFDSYANYKSKFTLLKFETNVPDFNKSDIEVIDSLYPDFSKNPVSRFIDGFSMEYGQIDIKNNSNYDYYFALFIVKSGVDVSFKDSSSFSSDQSGYIWNNPSGEIMFPFLKNEWFYTKSSSLNNKTYGDLVGQSMIKVYAPSAVHPVLNGKTLSLYFGFNQINLVKGGNYDLVCYAYTVDDVQGGHSVDPVPNQLLYSSSMNEVYRRSFTLSESFPYDSSKPSLATAGGTILGFDAGNPEESFDSIGGYIANHDPENLGDMSITPLDDKFSNLKFKYGDGSFKTDPNFKIGNYNQVFGSTMSFIAYFFNFFPPELMALFVLGFGAIIVIAIVKAVK